MKKNEVIQELKKGNFSNGVAEIICDVFSSQGTSHKNQSILVILDKYGYECVNDQINEIKHWFIFNSLNEFVERTQMMGNIEYPKISKPVSKIAVSCLSALYISTICLCQFPTALLCSGLPFTVTIICSIVWASC